jgi:hypothetical protein
VKTLLLNDTSHYHSGCKQVIKTLSEYYKPVNLCHTEHIITKEDIEDVDVVVLNGEGTMHHNAKNAVKFLTYLQIAQEMNKSTHVINTVWQDMDVKWKSVLMRCDILEVREVLSQRDIPCNAEVVLDASIHLPVKRIDVIREGVFVGGSFFGNIDVDFEHQRINIFDNSWEGFVEQLQHAKLLITGRHHEMYAALQARTPVITIPGNTWKNEAFFHTVNKMNLLIPPTYDNVMNTLRGMYDDSWQEIWRFLDGYTYKFKNNTRFV